MQTTFFRHDASKEVVLDESAPTTALLSCSDALFRLREVRDQAAEMKGSNSGLQEKVQKILTDIVKDRQSKQRRLNNTIEQVRIDFHEAVRLDQLQKEKELLEQAIGRKTVRIPKKFQNRNESNAFTRPQSAAVAEGGGEGGEDFLTPSRPTTARPEMTVHQRLYEAATYNQSPPFRQLHQVQLADPEVLKQELLQENKEKRRKGREIVRRNRAELEMIQEIVRGEVEVVDRGERIQKKIQQVQQNKASQLRNHQLEQKQQAEEQEALRQLRAAQMDQLDDFIIKLCSWQVIVKVHSAADAFAHILNTDVKEETENKITWAAVVLARSLPVQFRKMMRRRRLIRLGAAMRIVYFVVQRRRVAERKAINLIQHFLKELKKDPMLQVSRFMNHVMVATKATRNFMSVRRHQRALLQLQWRYMEAYLLLTEPSIGIPVGHIEKISIFERWDPDDPQSPLNGVPLPLRSTVDTDSYNVYMARWKRHCKRHGIALNRDGLPSQLEEFRAPDSFFESVINQHFQTRNRKVRRQVNSLYSMYLNEKVAARDMFRASKRLQQETAFMDVKRKYPNICDTSKLFSILVDFEANYSPSPFFQILFANIHQTLSSKLPKPPHFRVLFTPKTLKFAVSKSLSQQLMNREIVAVGSMVMLPNADGQIKKQLPPANKSAPANTRNSLQATITNKRKSIAFLSPGNSITLASSQSIANSECSVSGTFIRRGSSTRKARSPPKSSVRRKRM